MDTPAADSSRSSKPWRTKPLNAYQDAILQALLASERPLSSADLSRKVALGTDEARGHCIRLLKKGLLASQKRWVRRSFGDRSRRNPELFWTLTQQGLEYLAARGGADAWLAPRPETTA
jgi:predicted ArsR family transcriptional regulator